MLGYFLITKYGINQPKRKILEFRVTDDAILPSGYLHQISSVWNIIFIKYYLGTELTAKHFTVGQFIDVCGTRLLSIKFLIKFADQI